METAEDVSPSLGESQRGECEISGALCVSVKSANSLSSLGTAMTFLFHCWDFCLLVRLSLPVLYLALHFPESSLNILAAF